MLINAIEKEHEEKIYPMWLMHTLISAIRGEKAMSINEMVSGFRKEEGDSEETFIKLERIVERDKEGGKVG